MDEYAYRRATEADVDRLVELRMAFLAEVAGGDAADVELAGAIGKYFSDAIHSGEFVAFVAKADGVVIASSGMVFHRHPPSPANRSGRQSFIMNMYTVPPHRRRGIATQLLTRLLDHARACGCNSAALHALPQGRSMYERAGFTPTDTEMRLDLNR